MSETVVARLQPCDGGQAPKTLLTGSHTSSGTVKLTPCRSMEALRNLRDSGIDRPAMTRNARHTMRVKVAIRSWQVTAMVLAVVPLGRHSVSNQKVRWCHANRSRVVEENPFILRRNYWFSTDRSFIPDAGRA